MEPIKISIVSPVHNRKAETLQWLRSLALLDAQGYEIRMVVVDDGSTDGTAEAVREGFPETEIIIGDGNLWFTGGTNRGIEAALKHDPDYILTCNNDTIFDERSLKTMVNCAIKYPRSIVGPLLLNWDVPHKLFQVSPKWGLRYGGYRHWRNQTVWTVPGMPWEVDIIVGNCVLMPVAAVKEAGLMDEKRFVHYGDAEYTPRMRKMGWRLLIEPRARIFCKPNDAPERFRSLSLGKKLKALFSNTPNAHSIWRRHYMNIAAGPNYLQGLLATPIFYIRYLLGRNLEGEWAE
ncbi:MAG: glycosyltransferase family 2 protein, partial [Blastocatellia bacterium]|nr:glycosyltransferase family 2 protein [Blastocatellia bacterium]